MVGKAIAEFEFTLVFANAPLDRFARGDVGAMTAAQKRGALLFFGRAACVDCHAVAGRSNEMFSDFAEHVVGVPQVAPAFGANTGNVLFAGDGHDEDFGLEEITGNPADRYKFRTSPPRNPAVAGVNEDLRYRMGPIEPVLARIDPLLATSIELTAPEFNDLVHFVRDSLLDDAARPQELCMLIPGSVPSGRPPLQFQGCPRSH